MDRESAGSHIFVLVLLTLVMEKVEAYYSILAVLLCTSHELSFAGQNPKEQKQATSPRSQGEGDEHEDRCLKLVISLHLVLNIF
jgi:hypothetical protein